MPNGGSDCCGTCWFNRKNRGERDWHRHVDNTLPDHCEIRDLAIDDPFYTYCANHPHRRPERDHIPIGPVTGHGGWKEDQPEFEYPRYVWRPSPDNEEIRQHLLSLLDSIFEHMLDDQYPIGNRLGELVEARRCPPSPGHSSYVIVLAIASRKRSLSGTRRS